LRRGFVGIAGYVKKAQQKIWISLKTPKGEAINIFNFVKLLEKVSTFPAKLALF